MPKDRLIALNTNVGAFTDVLAAIYPRRVEVREDEATTTQGLQWKGPDDAFAQAHVVGVPGAPPQPQITLGNIVGNLRGGGPLIGAPAQAGITGTIAATKLLSLRSNGAATTSVWVKEIE